MVCSSPNSGKKIIRQAVVCPTHDSKAWFSVSHDLTVGASRTPKSNVPLLDIPISHIFFWVGGSCHPISHSYVHGPPLHCHCQPRAVDDSSKKLYSVHEILVVLTSVLWMFRVAPLAQPWWWWGVTRPNCHSNFRRKFHRGVGTAELGNQCLDTYILQSFELSRSGQAAYETEKSVW